MTKRKSKKSGKTPDLSSSAGALALPPIERTALGLRSALFDEIDGLRNNSVTPGHARALANLVRQCIDAARLDIQARKLELETSIKLGGELTAALTENTRRVESKAVSG